MLMKAFFPESICASERVSIPRFKLNYTEK